VLTFIQYPQSGDLKMKRVTHAIFATNKKSLITALKKCQITDYIIGDPDETAAEAELTNNQVEQLKQIKTITAISEL